MSFSDILKIKLDEKNLKQADLCRMTGIQTSLVSNYLSGKKSPTISNAILIADAFGISLDELVGRKPSELSIQNSSDKSVVQKFLSLNEKNKNKVEGIIDSYLIEEQEAATKEGA